jgi:hypothetical protein
MNGPTIHRAHGLEETVRRRDASGVGQILNMRRFRTSLPAGFSPNKCKQWKKDRQSAGSRRLPASEAVTPASKCANRRAFNSTRALNFISGRTIDTGCISGWDEF